jgi:hypothetical protein
LPPELWPIAEFVLGLEEDEETGELEGLQLEIDMAIVRGSAEHEMLDELEAAAGSVASYLELNPDDVDALILSARLGRLRIIFQPQVEVHGGAEMPDLPEPIAEAPLHAALELALELNPSRADAAYWRARLYGLAPAFGDSDPDRLAHAVDNAQLAVELDPTNMGYRIAAATYLYEIGHLGQAAATLEELTPDHPLAVWLNTVAAPPPVPEDAVPNEYATEDFGAIFRSRPDVTLSWNRAFVVLASISEVEAFYRTVIPNFAFVGCETTKSDGTEIRNCGQSVTPTAAGFEAANEEDFADEFVSGDFVFMATEMRGFDTADAPPEMQLPADLSDPFCLLHIANALSMPAPAADAEGLPSAAGSDGNLSLGECINEEQVDRYLAGSDYLVTSCNEPHDYEVYLVYEFPDGLYPGDAAVQDELASMCLDEFETFVGRDFESSSLNYRYIGPGQTGWRSGDRGGECLLVDVDGAKLTGTMRQSGR